MADNRFATPGTDARFPTPVADVRFPSPGVDAQFPGPGTDTRFTGTVYGGGGGGGGGAPPPSLFSFELLNEAGSANITDAPGLRVSINNGAWQTLAAAGLTISRTAANKLTVAGFANDAAALSARWHYEQQQPNEPYDAPGAISGLYARRVNGPYVANANQPGHAISATKSSSPVQTT